ncbi:hypothetical protein ACFWDW_09025, partial [Streptomyces roseolus]
PVGGGVFVLSAPGRGGAPPPAAGRGPARAGARGPGAQPAIADPGQLPLRPRPSLQAVRESEKRESRTVDLTAEDDTQALPRLDSLEAKISEMERLLG